MAGHADSINNRMKGLEKIAAAGGKQRMPVREYLRGEKPY